MTDNGIYGVWLQQVLGEGSRKAPLLIRYFGSCRKVYEADDIELRLSGLLTTADLQKFAQTPIDMAEEIVEACHRLRYGIITPDDENYPKRLLNIPDFPAALYYCGEWPDIDNEVVIGMVGTRIASRYGFTAATEIAKDLAACGAIVISGGARGIDTAAHQGTILSGGKTIAVLGCGINTRYNMENEGLRKLISVNGALISEYPPGAPPLNYHFPVRNRLISGLALGVVVVEAGTKSGSLITANLAAEQGKDVFAVPGEIGNSQAWGTNRLITDGAKTVRSAYDVLEEYVGRFPHRLKSVNIGNSNARAEETHVRPKWAKEERAGTPPGHNAAVRDDDSDNSPKPFPEEKPARRKQTDAGGKKKNGKKKQTENGEKTQEASAGDAPIGMSPQADKVRRALTAAPKSFEELLAELHMDPSELSRCITELELYAEIRTLPGNKYAKG